LCAVFHEPRHARKEDTASQVAGGGTTSAATSIAIAGCRLILSQGDLTRVATDAIVNAANASLLGGGGVDGAIHRRGGPEILLACQRLRAERYPDGLPTGEAVMTTAGRLPARHVIHTVGPVYSGRAEVPVLLAACHANSLALAVQEGLRTIAFPAISTGVYGYPIELAAPIALGATVAHLRDHPGVHDEVQFVLFSAAALAIFSAALGSPILPA
jgi:O-acetyl-ADP-ribose deacetylase (regulator of RNase III)